MIGVLMDPVFAVGCSDVVFEIFLRAGRLCGRHSNSLRKMLNVAIDSGESRGRGMPKKGLRCYCVSMESKQSCKHYSEHM